MKLPTGIRAFTRKDIVPFAITFILILGLWGSGLWALDQPDWNGGIDRLTYIQAVKHFFAQEPLYIQPGQPLPEDLNFFNYSPLAIFSVGLLSLLPPVVLFALHFLAVIALYWLWKRILTRNNIDVPTWILPIWFAFSPFVYDAVTLNVNVFMALLATLYLWFLLKEGRSAVLGAIVTLFLMSTIKPQWGFFALLPLVQRDWKKFGQLLVGMVVLTFLGVGAASLLTGPGYVLGQLSLYVKYLGTFAQRFTYWNLPPGPYEYNNSIYQVFIYLTRNIQTGITLARLIQAGLFVMLAVILARTILSKEAKLVSANQEYATLRWFFIFYCATLLYPPLNFDFSLGIPMFLFVSTQGRLAKILVGIPLLLVAFQDIIRMIIGSFIPGWFPFIFAATLIALFFLLIGKPVRTSNELRSQAGGV